MPLTETYSSSIPFWALAVSLLAVPFILWSSRRPNLRESFTILVAVIKFGLVLTLLPGAREGRVAEFVLLEIAEGIELSLRADAFGVFFAVIASGLWILTSFYSIGYMRGHHEKKQTRYFASFAVSLSATIGIAFAGNLLTFIIFYEMLTLATYPLVVHSENKEAIRAGRQYLAYALTAGLLMVAGAGWIYSVTGTIDFQPGGILEEGMISAGGMRVLFFMLMIGVGVKGGIMPLHSWLPAAMVAPTPVSALLHAVAVVKSGVFGVVRMAGFVFGPEVMAAHGLNIILATFAGFTIILASIIALRQNNLKRRLAYSTVAHLSYIAMGAALLNVDGFTGGILHISTHATMKITLFFCAGAIIVHLHKENVTDLDGAGRAMPWTFTAFAIGAMGLAGLPPINGFLSKWFLCMGSLEAGQIIVLCVFLISGLLNAAYLFPIVYRGFFKSSDAFNGYGEASPLMVVPLCLTAFLSVVFCLFPNAFFGLFDLAKAVAESVLGGG